MSFTPPQFHNRTYFRQWQMDTQKQERREDKEIEQWAASVINGPLVLTPENSPDVFYQRGALEVSYGQDGCTPPLPHFKFTTKKQKVSNTEKNELYKILAETYPNGINIKQANKLRSFHPEQLGDTSLPAIVQGVRRSIDRMKRKKFESFFRNYNTWHYF